MVSIVAQWCQRYLPLAFGVLFIGGLVGYRAVRFSRTYGLSPIHYPQAGDQSAHAYLSRLLVVCFGVVLTLGALAALWPAGLEALDWSKHIRSSMLVAPNKNTSSFGKEPRFAPVVITAEREKAIIESAFALTALHYSPHHADAHPKSEPIGSGCGTRSGPSSVVTASSNRMSAGKEARVGLASRSIRARCGRPIGRSQMLS